MTISMAPPHRTDIERYYYKKKVIVCHISKGEYLKTTGILVDFNQDNIVIRDGKTDVVISRKSMASWDSDYDPFS